MPGLPVTRTAASAHECLPRRDRPDRPPLDGPPVQLHDHARPGAALFQRPLHDDWPQGRQRQTAAARLFHRQRELRREPRVPQHQGAGRPAHLQAAAHQAGRQDHRRPQAHRHAADRLPAAGQAPLPAGQRHRSGALHQHRARPRNLRALREGHHRARRARSGRTGLPRPPHRGPAPARVPRRVCEQPVALLPDGHPRAL
mmetsp:Transcript_662/g.1444  ORF Transcript_662/g.1444 Transcript_662/m.1444 type:complete len:200 (-) Transcript_662:779-1378(-)